MPIPNAMNIAGSSKIPCGRRFIKENNPFLETLTLAATPKTNPFRAAFKRGKIPNANPKAIEKKVD